MIVHGTAVALEGRGLLIRGASGRGKSALALQMMGFGAGLVADDRVSLERQGSAVLARAPDSLPTLIEARGIGLLNVALIGVTPLCGVLDLTGEAAHRLPTSDTCDLMGQALPLFTGQIEPHLAAAMIQFLKAGRFDAQ